MEDWSARLILRLEELSQQFLKFAQINNVDVNSSIDNVQKAMSAYGLSADDAGAMLDTLNKVGQDTGISMDTLEQLMVQNSTALQSMGLNASDSAVLLGQLEKSGADVQFLWRYIDDLIGKGLTIDVMAQFFCMGLCWNPIMIVLWQSPNTYPDP